MYNIGDIVRANREELNISQEDLSYGICSVSNLSRIENGTQVPNRATYEALMQRMGLPAGLYPSFLNEKEINAFKLKDEISGHVTRHNYDKVEELIANIL